MLWLRRMQKPQQMSRYSLYGIAQLLVCFPCRSLENFSKKPKNTDGTLRAPTTSVLRNYDIYSVPNWEMPRNVDSERAARTERSEEVEESLLFFGRRESKGRYVSAEHSFFITQVSDALFCWGASNGPERAWPVKSQVLQGVLFDDNKFFVAHRDIVAGTGKLPVALVESHGTATRPSAPSRKVRISHIRYIWTGTRKDQELSKEGGIGKS